MGRIRTWPIQDIVLCLGLCARINTILCAPTLCLGTPPHTVTARTIAQYNVSPRPPVIAIYTTQYWQLQYLGKAKYERTISLARFVYIYIHIHIYAYMHTYIYVYIHMYIHSPCGPLPCLCLPVYIQIHLSVYIYGYQYRYLSINQSISFYIYV